MVSSFPPLGENILSVHHDRLALCPARAINTQHVATGVNLPEPDVPTIATNSPFFLHLNQLHQRMNCVIAGAINLFKVFACKTFIVSTSMKKSVCIENDPLIHTDYRMRFFPHSFRQKMKSTVLIELLFRQIWKTYFRNGSNLDIAAFSPDIILSGKV